ADSGDGQAATVNTPVAVPPIVLVRDQYSNAIPGVAVTFTVTGGGGSITPIAPVATDASGRARVTTWTLGTGAGTNPLGAAADGGSGNVPISQTAPVTVNAGAPASVNVVNSGFSARVGTGVGTLPTYTVRDPFSNLVPNFSVSYSSSNSGAFTGPNTTNASGQVTLT